MIVVEESDVRKSRNRESNGAVATPNTPLIPAESPPAYTLRDGPGPSSSSAHPSYTPQSPPVTQKRRPKPAATRFFEALLLALGACAAIVFVVKLLAHIIYGPPHDVRCTRRLSHSFSTSENCSEAVFPNIVPRNGWIPIGSRWQNHPLR
jgi:hypothetical protein